MAFTTLFVIVSLVAITSAGFPGWSDDEAFPAFPGFGPPLMSLRFAAPPTFTMPKFPPIPSPPMVFFNFPPFPSMPPIKFPPMPSPKDIASAKPAPGGTLQAAAFSMNSEVQQKEDGTIVKKGGSTIITNDNGKVKVYQTGDRTPTNSSQETVTVSEEVTPVEEVTTRSSFDFEVPKIKPFKPYKFKPLFEKNHFSSFKPSINREAMKNYVPKKGEEYEGYVKQETYYSKDINGKKEEGGSSSSVINNNGKVKADDLVYHKDLPPKN